MADGEIDAGKLIQKLLDRNGQLTLDLTVKEVQIEDLTKANHMLTAALQRISENNTQGEESEEINEVLDGTGSGVDLHGGSESGDGEQPDHGGDQSADPDAERSM